MIGYDYNDLWPGMDRNWVEERVVYYLEKQFPLCWSRDELCDFIDKEIRGRKDGDLAYWEEEAE